MRMIKKIVFFLLSAVILLMTGCQSTQDDIYSQAMGRPSSASEQGLLTSEADGLSGKLTIKTLISFDENTAMYFLIQEFMKLHPDVTIDVDSSVSSLEWANMSRAEIQMAKDSFSSGISMEIGSGEADYIMYDVRDRINIPQFTRNGLLIDLYQFWNHDPELNHEDYFTHVLEGFEVDGKLATLPIAFSFYDLYLNREILDELQVDPESIETVDANRVLDWYEQARELHGDLNLNFSSPGKDGLYYYLERCRYIDLENRDAAFDSPEFIEFLTRTNNALNEDPGLDQQLLGMGNNGGLLDANISYRKTGKYPENIFAWKADTFKTVVENARPGFFVLEDSFLPNLITMQQPKEYAVGPYPLTSSDGKLGVRSVEEFCVPVSMKNQPLAWEFIRYCISARDREYLDFAEMGSSAAYTNRIPLCKTTFQNMLADIDQNGLHDLSVGYSDFDTIDPAAMTEMMDRILDRPIVNIDLYSVDVDEFLLEFYDNGLTTPEQCAEKMQGRAYIWLNE